MGPGEVGCAEEAGQLQKAEPGVSALLPEDQREAKNTPRRETLCFLRDVHVWKIQQFHAKVYIVIVNHIAVCSNNRVSPLIKAYSCHIGVMTLHRC